MLRVPASVLAICLDAHVLAQVQSSSHPRSNELVICFEGTALDLNRCDLKGQWFLTRSCTTRINSGPLARVLKPGSRPSGSRVHCNPPIAHPYLGQIVFSMNQHSLSWCPWTRQAIQGSIPSNEPITADLSALTQKQLQLVTGWHSRKSGPLNC